MNPRVSLLLLAALMASALAISWVQLSAIGRTDPWYRNVDMNIHNMADALSINSGVAPNQIDQPALPTKFLLAVSYRLMHLADSRPVWDIATLNASADPIREMPALIHALRVHNRGLLMVFLLGAAALVWTASGKLSPAALVLLLLAASPAIAFHGMLSRPELLCVTFGAVLAPICTLQATATDRAGIRHLWLLLAGCLAGLALLEKLLGVAFLAMCCGWCWLTAWAGRAAPAQDAPRETADSRWDLLPVVWSATLLGLLVLLVPHHEKLGPVALLRLRLAALGIALLPLLSLWPGHGRLRNFCVARAREQAAFGSGVLAAFILTYGALRIVLPPAVAGDYFARALGLVVDPGRELHLLTDTTNIGPVIFRHLRENAVLFAAAVAFTASLYWLRAGSARLRLFTALLCASALGMIVMLGNRHFTIHYEIYYQTPLYVAVTLALWAQIEWLASRLRPARLLLPLALFAAAAVLLTARPRVQNYYLVYQDDAHFPVSELTVTFIFDHDSKTRAYLDLMSAHYRDRRGFREAIDAFLADPANRY